jgi:hypothetical protein|nr:MAG TPA: hypothetical protein [Caudoviricetes sp.]
MTKEQAIEILKCFKDNKIQRDKLEIDNRCGGWKIGRIYKSLELNTAIETVLSILEEQEKKIADLQKSVEQIYDDYQDIGKMAFNYSDKIEKQNKIIDLMAEKIYEEGIVWDNKEEVKQYFENKAKESE